MPGRQQNSSNTKKRRIINHMGDNDNSNNNSCSANRNSVNIKNNNTNASIRNNNKSGGSSKNKKYNKSEVIEFLRRRKDAAGSGKRVKCRCCLAEEKDEIRSNYLRLDTPAACNFDGHLGHNIMNTKNGLVAGGGNDSSSSMEKPMKKITLLDCLNGCARIDAPLLDDVFAANNNSNSNNKSNINNKNSIDNNNDDCNDAIPRHICLDCCQALEACCEFIRCVQNADKLLRGKWMKQHDNDGGDVLASTLHQNPLYASNTFNADKVRGNNVVAAILDKNENSIFTNQEKIQPKKEHLFIGNNDLKAHMALPRLQLPPTTLNSGQSVQLSIDSSETQAHQNRMKGEAFKCLANDNNNVVGKETTKNTRTTATTLNEGKDNNNNSKNNISSPQIIDTESYFVKSFDSGIEFDDDLTNSQIKLTPCNPNATNQTIQLQLEQFDGHSYVIPLHVSQQLHEFHKTSDNNENPMHKCGFCTIECETKQEFNKHLEIHLGLPCYNCKFCNFVCRFKYYLEKHMRQSHNVYENLNAGSSTNDKSSLLSMTTTMHEYHHTITKYYCNLCKRHLINYDVLQQHLERHRAPFYQCTMCTYRETARESILEHMAREHKLFVDQKFISHYIPIQNPIKCNIINPININQTIRGVSSDSASKQNSKTIKLSNKNYHKHRTHLCQFCGHRFARRFHLLKHEYCVHKMFIDITEQTKQKILKKACTKNTKFKYIRQRKAAQTLRCLRCIDCRHRIFETKEDLLKHKSEHTQMKFQCKVCSQEFLFNFELKYHMRTHKAVAIVSPNMDSMDLECLETADDVASASSVAAAAASIVVSTTTATTMLAPSATMIAPARDIETMEAVPTTAAPTPSVAIAQKKYDLQNACHTFASPQTILNASEFINQRCLSASTLCRDKPFIGSSLMNDSPSTISSCSNSSFNNNSHTNSTSSSCSIISNGFDINFNDLLYLNEFDLNLLDSSRDFYRF